jgi:phage gp36-like protein
MYCSQTDIETYIPPATLIELTDDDSTGEVNTTIVESVISDASEMVDGYLRGLYEVPVQTVPKLVKTITVDLCVHALYGRRLTEKMPESLTSRYKNALSLLKQIKLGEVMLGVTSAGSADAEVSASFVLSNKREKYYTS